MAKKIRFVCQSCQAETQQWQGQCPQCRQWNSLQESVSQSTGRHYAGENQTKAVRLADVEAEVVNRVSSGIGEFDRVLGGGLVAGGAILLGGDPGVGKSTLLLQLCGQLSLQKKRVLYVTGEESLGQVAMRAGRLQSDTSDTWLLATTDVLQVIKQVDTHQPTVVVIDSIQTVHHPEVSAAPGSVSQVRECAMCLVQLAKTKAVTVFFIGHVTKEGHVAGPRVLEHIVDSVLYLEGEMGSRYRLLRAIKNRFGPVHELGIFAMQERGMQAVKNPSALFLNQGVQPGSGSVVMATWEGTRALLVEIQALLDESYAQQPRRVVVGLDGGRVSMLVAVIQRHARLTIGQKDLFVNAVGGLKITETASDLALMVAIISSVLDKPISRQVVIFGEVGLNGEVRPIANGQARLQAAQQQGFTRALVPKANRLSSVAGQNMIVTEIDHVRTLVRILQSLAVAEPAIVK